MHRLGFGQFCVWVLCLLHWHPIWLAQACPPQSSVPEIGVRPLLTTSRIQMVNISTSISQLYNDSDAHLAYFFPNASEAWVQFTCIAPYPIEIEIDSVMAVGVDNLTYARNVTEYDEPCSYRYNVTFLLKLNYSVTGNYICQKIKRSGRDSVPAAGSNSSAIHLFVNDGGKPALLNAQLNFQEVEAGIPDDQGLIRVPCITTDPYREPQLSKGLLSQGRHNATKGRDYVRYVPGRGFFISAQNNVTIGYSCALDEASLKIRLRNLATNTGPGIPTHFRVDHTPPGETIYNSNSFISFSVICESNKPIRFDWSLLDPKLSFDVRQTQVKDMYYKYKAILVMNGQIGRTFSVNCKLNETNGILTTWRYELADSDTDTLSKPGITRAHVANQRHFQCVSSEKKTPLIALITCGNHMNCKMAQRFSDLINLRPKFYPFQFSRGYACYKPQGDAGCAIIPLAVGNRTGLVMCQEEPANQDNEKPVVHYQNYHTGFEGIIITELNTEHTPNHTLRFWSPSVNRDPDQDQDQESLILYVGENVTFVCEATTFIFAKGIQFFVHFENGSAISAHQYEPNVKVQETSEGDVITSQATFPIKGLDVTKVECSAPLWNTHTWRNVSHNISCAQGEPIRFSEDSVDAGDGKVEATFTVSEVDQRINCEAWGYPQPKLWWAKDGQNVSITARANNITLLGDDFLGTRPNGSEVGVRSVLLFTEVKEFHKGVYVCHADNRKSVGSKPFVVNVLKLEETNTWTTYVLGFSCALGVFLAIGILIWYRLRKNPPPETGKLTEIEIIEFMQGNQDMKQKYKDLHENARYLPYKQDFEIPQNKLDIHTEDLLGSGMSGLVYKGILTKHGSKIPVAIKTVRSSDIGTLKILLSEIKILMYIGSHANVINLLGARTSELREGKLHAVVEFCKFGCLQEFIRGNRDNFFDQIVNDEVKGDLRPQENKSKADARISKVASTGSWKLNDFLVNVSPDSSSAQVQALAANSRNSKVPPNREVTTMDLVRWSHQIASGMEYLGAKKVIHGDLALRNILLAEDMQIKITDFGLSRHLRDYEIYYRKRKEDMLPWRWLAIEAARDSRFSIETDIWAYAVTLWEIYSLAETPYQGRSWGEEFVRELTDGYRLSQAKYSSKGIHDMMLKCWNKNPSQRPTFTELKQYFHGLAVISTQKAAA